VLLSVTAVSLISAVVSKWLYIYCTCICICMNKSDPHTSAVVLFAPATEVSVAMGGAPAHYVPPFLTLSLLIMSGMLKVLRIE